MTDAIVKKTEDVVLQLPVRLVREVANIQVDVPVVHESDMRTYDPLMIAASPWAVLYRNMEDGPLHVAGFNEKEQLSDLISSLYRNGQIDVVLRAGRPVKFDMRVKARIG